MKRRNTYFCMCLLAAANALVASTLPASEGPLEIGSRTQFFIDDHIVDNRWSLRPKREELVRAFHAPVKRAEPVIAGKAGYVTAVRDAESGAVKLWYQVAIVDVEEKQGAEYAVAFAESSDGLKFTLPKLELIEWQGTKANNIVWRGPGNTRASGPQILQVPEKDRRNFRYLLTYRTSGAGRDVSGIRVVGSQDGIHWDSESDSLIMRLGSDTLNSIVYDADRNRYVMFCRPKDRYLTFKGEQIDTGESRRIAMMTGTDLWQPWSGSPETILIPDELDVQRGFNRFYGMSTRWHEGIYWGALWCFKLNTDITTELAWSRDGRKFERLPLRPKMFDLGPADSWDDGMVFGGMDWIEMGDEWWFYYAGHDGPHESRTRNSGIGLATLRKEGLVSLHGPTGGGVVCTKLIRWPGGDLQVNADARQGELKVRISDDQRKPLEGFDYSDQEPFSGDAVRHSVRWRDASLEKLKGQSIRLEFFLRDADLYTFRAAPQSN